MSHSNQTFLSRNSLKFFSHLLSYLNGYRKTRSLLPKKLSRAIGKLKFSEPVTHVYNPLQYAWPAHEQYIRMMNPKGTKVLFLGMNPGPWGMVQTGVPFGQIAAVSDWLKIDAPIAKPNQEHPKRPVQGLACQRNEVSGDRLWGLIRDKFKTPK